VQGLAVFSYPAKADVWRDIHSVFTPVIDDSARAVVARLEEVELLIAAACERKGRAGALPFDPLLRSTPMDHQREALHFAWSMLEAGLPGAFQQMEMGTGKSLVAIGLANGLHAAGKIRYAMVLVPNSLKGTWGALDGEILKHSLRPCRIVVLRGSRAARERDLSDAMAELRDDPSLLWIVNNYEQFREDPRKSETLPRTIGILRRAPGMLICDESTEVKSPRANTTRCVLELSTNLPYRVPMTGAPITKGPLDVWAQTELIERGILGYSSYIAFERTHAVTEERRSAHGTYPAITGYRNLEDLERRLGRFSYRVKASECLQLPPVTIQRIPVELNGEQERMLTKLRDEMAVELDGGAAIDGRNILTRYLRMAEVIGGFPHILGPDGQPAGVHRILPNPKLEATRAFTNMVFDSPARKLVVFANFVAEVEAITEALAEWGAMPFYGAVKERDREANRIAFNEDPTKRVLVCQYQTGSMGLNLTVADTTLFYSLTFSLKHYLQARKRVDRHGQKAERVLEAYLLADSFGRNRKPRQTLDQIQLRGLQMKTQLADMVTGDARGLLASMM
jgi:SNF2 family DNA or RNA helicase